MAALAYPHPILFFMLFLSFSSSPHTVISTTTTTASSLFPCFNSIVSLGDSIADTGNDLLPALHTHQPLAAYPPYGRTFFHSPTGRFSDGRLIIDFIAESLGLPLVQPYFSETNKEGRDRSFTTGVNFAVSGATALPDGFYVQNPYTNVSLGVQLEWFKTFLTQIPDGRKYLSSSLVLAGEIGGNDFNHALAQGASLHQLQSFVQPVTDYIGSTIQELIKLGAVTMLVPGNFPIGCVPVFLTQFQESSTDKDYDPITGCLNWLNDFAVYQNEMLQKELSRIRELHPHVNIVYADYYNAALQIYRTPDQFGFGRKNMLKSCCGVGGQYNFSVFERCGRPKVKSCDDPSAYVSWDGLHFTEAFYGWIARGLVEGPYADPPLKALCPNLLSKMSGGYFDL